MKLSVIMPVYEASHRVAEALSSVEKTLNKAGFDYEIVVVDDGSRDPTAIKVNGYVNGNHNGRIRLISYKHNMGKGYALKIGAEHSRGDVVTFLDGDGAVKLNGVTDYLTALNHTDIVIASKRHPNSKVKAPWSRRVLSRSFHLLAVMLLGLNVSDTQSGLKFFRTTSLRKILPLLSVKKYAFDVEVLAVAKLMGLKVKETPVQLELKRMFSPLAIVRMLVDLLGITYRMRVLGWYQKNLNNRHPKYKPILEW